MSLELSGELLGRLDAATLRLLRATHPEAARPLVACCHERAQVCAEVGGAGAQRGAWQMARAAFGAVATGALPIDTDLKRVAMQQLMYARALTQRPGAAVPVPHGLRQGLLESVVRASVQLAQQARASADSGAASAPADDAAAADFLQDADAWSQQLDTQIAAWQAGAPASTIDDAIDCAHALCEACDAAGLTALGALVRHLGHGLLCARHVPVAVASDRSIDAQLLRTAADDIRSLLHRYAAGFVRAPSTGAIDGLLALMQSAVSAQRASDRPLFS